MTEGVGRGIALPSGKSITDFTLYFLKHISLLSRSETLRLTFVLMIAVASGKSHAGEIPAVPPRLPPILLDTLHLNWGNDVFTLGGTQDDFRTQQVFLSARLSDRWILSIDHSILTFRGPTRNEPDPIGTEGRLDQLSTSFGYMLYQRQEPSFELETSSGLGFRASGNLAGARIQNGFHRLIDNGLIDLPYVDTERTDGLIWLQGNLQYLKPHVMPDWLGWLGADWRSGYWLYAATLATTDLQWDGTANVSALAAKGPWKLWLGLRADWREGYDRDIVQTATAANEEGTSFSFGLALGSLVLETTQNLDSDTGFGRVGFNADPAMAHSFSGRKSGFGTQFSIFIPEVYFQLQGRWLPSFLNSASVWGGRLYSIVDARYGEPPLGNSTEVFVESMQLTVGGEWETEIRGVSPWIKPYIGLSLGWRREQVVGDEELSDVKSDAVDRAVLVGDAGLRFDMAGNRRSWHLQLLLGLSGWVPLNDARVMFHDSFMRIQKPDVSAVTGFTLSFL